jgi:putative CocE/NonD family hydrolase
MMAATEHTMVGERDMGDARLPYEDIYLAWFDQHLKGVENTFQGQPKVRVFLMGANRWLNSDQWPLKGISQTRYFLGSRGHANSALGNGMLSESTPKTTASFDEVMADPNNPVPSRGAGCCDPGAFHDQAAIEARDDVLVYTTPMLTQGRAVVGDVDAVLYVSASTKDADIAFKLVDVDEQGNAFNLQDSILRLRYRNGFASPELMDPGHIYRVEIRGVATGNYFAPGHRMRIELAGTNFPNYERNLNTGGHNYDETRALVSAIRIYHDSAHASYINVPVYTAYDPGR